MNGIVQDLRYALKGTVKTPGFAGLRLRRAVHGQRQAHPVLRSVARPDPRAPRRRGGRRGVSDAVW